MKITFEISNPNQVILFDIFIFIIIENLLINCPQ